MLVRKECFMPEPYSLGIHLGTGRYKITLITTDGTPVAHSFAEYETAHLLATSSCCCRDSWRQLVLTRGDPLLRL